MASQMKEVYFLHDKDENLYKIGNRGCEGAGNKQRFLTARSLERNGYVTDIVALGCSKQMASRDAETLERQLHAKYAAKRFDYPALTLTARCGKVSTRRPNGYKEWFALSEAEANEVLDTLAS